MNSKIPLTITKSGQTVFTGRYQHFGLTIQILLGVGLFGVAGLAGIISSSMYQITFDGKQFHNNSDPRGIWALIAVSVLAFLAFVFIMFYAESRLNKREFRLEDLKDKVIEYEYQLTPAKWGAFERVGIFIAKEHIYMLPSEFDKFKTFLEQNKIKVEKIQ